MKLELKHLSSYLPYELSMLKTGDKNKRIHYLVGITQTHLQFDLTDGKYYEPMNLLNGIPFKPILRPLSDLTKEINIDFEDEKFIPYKVIKRKGGCNSDSGLLGMVESQTLRYSYMNLLFQWHFDVFGLIDKGLAININTI